MAISSWLQVVVQLVALLAAFNKVHGEYGFASSKSGIIKSLNKPVHYLNAGESLKLAWRYELLTDDVLTIFYCGYYNRGKPPLVPLAFDTTGTNFVSVYDQKPPSEERLPADKRRLSRFFVSLYDKDSETYFLELKNADSSLGTLNISCELRYERETHAPVVIGESILLHVASASPAILDTFELGWRAMGAALLFLIILFITVLICACVCRKRCNRRKNDIDLDIEMGSFDRMKQKLIDKKQVFKGGIPNVKKKFTNEKREKDKIRNGDKSNRGRTPPKIPPPPRTPARPQASSSKPMRPPAPQAKQKAPGVPSRPPPPSAGKPMRPGAPDSLKRPARPPDPRSVSPGKRPARPPSAEIQRPVGRSAPVGAIKKSAQTRPPPPVMAVKKDVGKVPSRPPEPNKEAREKAVPSRDTAKQLLQPDTKKRGEKPSRPAAPGVGKSRSHTNQSEKTADHAEHDVQKSRSHTSSRERPSRPTAPKKEAAMQLEVEPAQTKAVTEKTSKRTPMLKGKDRGTPIPPSPPDQIKEPAQETQKRAPKLIAKKERAQAPVEEVVAAPTVTPPSTRSKKKKRLERNQSSVEPGDLQAAMELNRKAKLAHAQKAQAEMIFEEDEEDAPRWGETKSTSHVSIDMEQGFVPQQTFETQETFDVQQSFDVQQTFDTQQTFDGEQTFDYGGAQNDSFDHGGGHRPAAPQTGESFDYEQPQASFDDQSFYNGSQQQQQQLQQQQQQSVDYEYDEGGFPPPPDMTFDASMDAADGESFDWPDPPRGH